MPTYEYACTACHHAWEELQRISEPATVVCPVCKKRAAQRLISAANFILKGGGWYADLYSSPKAKPAKEQANGASGGDSSSRKSERSSKEGTSGKGESKDASSSKTESKGDGAKPGSGSSANAA